MIINPILYSGKKLPELENPGTAADLLAGKQLVDQYGNPLTGTMPQRSAGNLTASGAEIIVPAGYYPSQVSKSVATTTHPKPTLSRSGGTITATHVQGVGYTSGGTTTETLSITTQAGKTVTPTTSKQTAVASGRLTTGAVYVEGDANLKAENIKSGVSIFGVAGTASTEKLCTVTTNYYASVSVFFCKVSGSTVSEGSFPNAPIPAGIYLLSYKNRYSIPNISVSGQITKVRLLVDDDTGGTDYLLLAIYGDGTITIS